MIEVSLLPVLVCGMPCHRICSRTWTTDISSKHWKDKVVLDHGIRWLFVFVRLRTRLLTYLL